MEYPSGVVVQGRPGRLLVFSSQERTHPDIPVYTSLHQGIMRSDKMQRKLTILGWDGNMYETSGKHECIGHA